MSGFVHSKVFEAPGSRRRGAGNGEGHARGNLRPGQGRAEKLTLQQRVFIEEFFAKGMNATAAYLAAGYAPGPNARSNAWKLLRRPLVRQAIEARRERHALQARMSAADAQRILEGIARDELNEPRERIMAIRTWAVMTGNDRPAVGRGEGDPLTRRELELLSDEELIEMVNRGTLARPALPPPMEVELVEGAHERKE